MSEEIIKVLDALCEKFGGAVDWTAENVLPYAQQLLNRLVNYEIATSILYIIIAAAILLVSGVSAAIFIPKAIEDEWSNEWPAVLAGLAAVICVIMVPVFVVVCAVQAKNIITCCTFPEKILLDYATSFLIL